MKIKTDYDGCRYIKAGKEYEVIEMSRNNNFAHFVDEDGETIRVRLGVPAGHLDGIGHFEIVSDKYIEPWKKGDVRDGVTTEAQINKADHHATIVVWREDREEAIAIRDCIVDMLNALETPLDKGNQVNSPEIPDGSEWKDGMPPVGAEFEFSTNGTNWEERTMLFNDGITCLMANKKFPANRWHTKCCDPDVMLRPIRTPEQIAAEKKANWAVKALGVYAGSSGLKVMDGVRARAGLERVYDTLLSGELEAPKGDL